MGQKSKEQPLSKITFNGKTYNIESCHDEETLTKIGNISSNIDLLKDKERKLVEQCEAFVAQIGELSEARTSLQGQLDALLTKVSNMSWNDVQNKPETYKPAAHNHDDLYPSKTGSGASGKWNIDISGNAETAGTADKASTPLGFNGRATSVTWGKASQIGDYVTDWHSPGGGDIAFVESGDANSNKQLNVFVDGQYYADEGKALVLNENNYNNYAPTKTGYGASGKWNIDISGKADTSGVANAVNGIYTQSGGIQPPSYFGKNRAGFLMSSQSVNGHSFYKNWLYMDNYGASDAGGASAIGVARDSARAFIMSSDATRKDWNWSAELLSTANYQDYVPTKTGAGASGIWDIDIRGRADTAGTATVPYGFVRKVSGNMPGKGSRTGIGVTCWDSNGAEIDFLRDGNQLNVLINGQYYAEDGDCLVLHEGNYNNYAPTKTGGGASGTWGINITGKANTAGTADVAKSADAVAWGNVSGRPSSLEPVFNNGKWYNVGDDVKIGDFNHGGLLGICGLNAATGIGLAKKGAETDYASITYDGGNIVFNKTLQANITGKAGSVDWGNVSGKPSLMTTSGGTFTGNLTMQGTAPAIFYNGSKANASAIRFIDNTADNTGNGISIGCGGLTVVGGGEAATAVQENFKGGEEKLILCNDGPIDIYTNLQDGLGKGWHGTIDNNGVYSGTAACAKYLENTAPNGYEMDLILGRMAVNDAARIHIGGTDNSGWLEIATADDGIEPIYVRQYLNDGKNTFVKIVHSAVLLDTNGNTSFPGIVTASTFRGTADVATTAYNIPVGSGKGNIWIE